VTPVGIRLPALPFLAAGLQWAAGLPGVRDGTLREPAVLISHAVVAAWLAVNALRHVGVLRLGVVLALCGWLMNLAVMLPNGGMPVSSRALDQLAASGVDVTDGHLSKHVPLTDSTVLPQLGDVHPLPALRLAYSAGDVLLLAGLLVIVGAVARGREPAAEGLWRPQLSDSVR
jgi:hypothetical protein